MKQQQEAIIESLTSRLKQRRHATDSLQMLDADRSSESERDLHKYVIKSFCGLQFVSIEFIRLRDKL